MPQNNSDYPWLTDEVEDELTSGFTDQPQEKSVIIKLEGSGVENTVVLAGQIGQWLYDQDATSFRLVLGDEFVAIEFSVTWLGSRITDIRSGEYIRINAPGLQQINLPDGQVIRGPHSGQVQAPQHRFVIDHNEHATELQPFASATFETLTTSRIAPLENVHRHRRRVRDDVACVTGLLRHTTRKLANGESPVWTEQFCTDSLVENFFQINVGPADQNDAIWLQVAFVNDRINPSPSDNQPIYAFVNFLTNIIRQEVAGEESVTDKSHLWQRWMDGLRIRADKSGISKAILITWSEPEQQQRFDTNNQPCDIDDPLGFIPINLEVSPFQTDQFETLDRLFVPSHYSEDWEHLIHTVEGATYQQSPHTTTGELLQDAYQAWNLYSGTQQLIPIRERSFGVEIEVIGISTDTAARCIRRYNIMAEPEEYNHQTRSHWKCVPDSSLLATRGAIRLPDEVQNEPDDDEIAVGPDCNEPQAVSDFVECDRTEDEEPCEDERCRRCNLLEEDAVGEIPGSHSAEIVSPILTYGVASDWNQLTKVTDALQDADAQVNRRCGFHVHVNVKDLSMQQIANVVNTYLNISWLFDQLLDRSRRGNFNCRHLTDDQRRELNDLLVGQGITPESDAFRYTSINVSAYLRQGTIEFRQHQGTLDFEKIKNWVHLCVGMVQAAGENRLSSQPEWPDPENGILSLLDQMVDGPTALWFMQRRRQLNSEATLTQQTHLESPPESEFPPINLREEDDEHVDPDRLEHDVRSTQEELHEVSTRISRIMHSDVFSDSNSTSNTFEGNSLSDMSNSSTRF